MKGLASRSSSPFSATLQTPSEQRFPAGLGLCAEDDFGVVLPEV